MLVKERLDANGLELWGRGWTDIMIGNKLGCCKASVCAWRKRRGLRANAPSGSEDWRLFLPQLERQARVLQLHEEGISDREGAQIEGITSAAYRKRRHRLGLRPNQSHKPQNKKESKNES